MNNMHIPCLAESEGASQSVGQVRMRLMPYTAWFCLQPSLCAHNTSSLQDAINMENKKKQCMAPRDYNTMLYSHVLLNSRFARFFCSYASEAPHQIRRTMLMCVCVACTPWYPPVGCGLNHCALSRSLSNMRKPDAKAACNECLKGACSCAQGWVCKECNAHMQEIRYTHTHTYTHSLIHRIYMNTHMHDYIIRIHAYVPYICKRCIHACVL